MAQPKPWYKSITITVNTVIILLGIVVEILQLLTQQPFISAQTIPYILFAISVINIVLRLITTQPVTPTILAKKVGR